MKREAFHWADQVAEKLLRKKKDKYVLAAGITPSGTIHIGNFREMITVDLVAKALENKGKKVRFIYSWDDYDRLRKVPKNMPKQDLLKKYLGNPIVDTPDVFGCHKSYAEHLEKEVEENLPLVGINPEFIYQSKMYRDCKYVEGIKKALDNKEKIIEILNKYRKDHLTDWWPVAIYCEECSKDETKILHYESYELDYECVCGYKGKLDFRKNGNVKLSWRVDWPMRWYYEKVDFEPGGKDHSTTGGSYDTGKQIVKEVWDFDAPDYIMYDFVRIKGMGGKISSSKGNVITLKEVLEVYEPAIVRFLFAGTRPNTEFDISFDEDVIKIYSDFDKCERIYFGKEEVKEDKLKKEKRIYELSKIDIPKEMPFQPNFRHLSMLVQIYDGDIEKVVELFEEKEKVRIRAEKAFNWVKKYAPEDYRFEVQKEVNVKVSEKGKKALKLLAKKLENKYDEEGLFNEFYDICKTIGIENKEFFKEAYQVLINKDKGPRLAGFILAIGAKKVAKLFNEIK